MDNNKHYNPTAANDGREMLTTFRAAKNEAQRLRLEVQRELGLVRQIRGEIERYQQETEAKTRSEANMLILQARLTIQKEMKEIAELKYKVNEQSMKLMADLRMTRIAAQEEFEAQRKFTSAARIKALTSTCKEAEESFANEEEVVGV